MSHLLLILNKITNLLWIHYVKIWLIVKIKNILSDTFDLNICIQAEVRREIFSFREGGGLLSLGYLPPNFRKWLDKLTQVQIWIDILLNVSPFILSSFPSIQYPVIKP